ncbi:MAG: 4Fe-4S binding protein [Phocaeicola sp.]
MNTTKLQQLARLVTCLLMIVAVAITQSQKLFGYELKELQAESATEMEQVVSQQSGLTLVTTATIAGDIMGYGGTLPLRITLEENKITSIEPLRNAETPQFFAPVVKRIIPQLIGLTPQEALSAQIDAVSGATLSSDALVATVNRGMNYLLANDLTKERTDWSFLYSFKFLVTLLVVLAGALVPLFLKNKRYRLFQLILNVVVLGFWSGSFLSYSLFVNYVANGVTLGISIIPLLFLVTAFLYPLFGKKNHYCTWLCPLGSLQELAGKSVKKKWSLSPRVLQGLRSFHDLLWALLMLLLWSGVAASWMDYEPFSAFLFQQASIPVLVIAGLSLALSFVVNRPYCRFVCPTGSFIQLSQKNK